MAEGEAPVNFITRNFDLSVTSSVITTMSSSEFSLISSSSVLYGSLQPKLALGPSGLNACAFTGGYAQVSVLAWLNNPYSNSISVKSPLLRLSLSAQRSTISIATTLNKRSASVHASGVPVYSITLQFSGVQNFNFSAGAKYLSLGQTLSRSNLTLPACRLYNGFAYVPCKGCNISSYTNYNVTYGCYDITQLCPSTNVRRNLFEDENENETEIGREGRYESNEDARSPNSPKFRIAGRRSLDVSSEETQAVTYGMIVSSIIAELSTVLSVNPLSLNPANSVVILIFVSSLGGIILIVLLVLIRLDNAERLNRIYTQSSSDTATRKMLEKSLKCGGQGDLREVYQLCSQKVRSDMSAKQGMTGSMNRSTARASSIMKWLYRITVGGKEEHPHIDSGKLSDRSVITYQINNLHSSRDRFSNEEESKDSYELAVLRKRQTAMNAGGDTDSEDKYSKEEDNGYDDPQSDRQIANTAIITEFLQKLFPGCSIFSGKNDAFRVIVSNHDYFKMFIGSDVTKSRTIRFLDVVTVVLSSIFADTIFFGIFYPSDVVCTTSSDEVTIFYFCYKFWDEISLLHFLWLFIFNSMILF
jgi:hypothetical protein